MTVTQWSTYVNSKFYSFNEQTKDNYIVNETLSGRVVAYKRNSRDIRRFSCKLKVKRPLEEQYFLSWFEQMGGLAGAFSCSALGSGVYRFSSIPTPQDTEQRTREFQLEIEEVY